MDIRKATGRGNELLVALDGEGRPWATNRYWLVPAARVAPLLEKYGFDPAVAGRYSVGRFGEPVTLSDAPSPPSLNTNLKTIMDDEYSIDLNPVTKDGEELLFRRQDELFALYEGMKDDEDKKDIITRINLTYLDWVIGNNDDPAVYLNGTKTVVKVRGDQNEVAGFLATTRKQ